VRGVLAAEETLLLDNWAIPVQAGTWRLDREKSLSAIEKGHDIAELKGFLESTGGLPLPAPVESFIGLCEHNGKALKTLGSALLIECRDAETAAEIAGRPETSSLCLRAGPKDAGGSHQPARPGSAKGFARWASGWSPEAILRGRQRRAATPGARKVFDATGQALLDSRMPNAVLIVVL
jgi:hypothetical protein